jgi:Flp pilus assembly protein TadB
MQPEKDEIHGQLIRLLKQHMARVKNREATVAITEEETKFQRALDDDERKALSQIQAWRDWRRVEACVWFGLDRHGLFLLVATVVWTWLRPISGWLLFAAIVVMALVHLQIIARSDARNERNEEWLRNKPRS